MAKKACNFPTSLDTLDTDRTAGQVITSDSYDVIENAITEVEKYIFPNKIIYPQDYATGTGTSGDPWMGDCLNDAYTACPTGGTIYMRAGYYEATTGTPCITINKPINIIGAGIGKTFLVTASDMHGIYMGDTATNYVTLQGFTLDGDAQLSDSWWGITCVGGDSYLTFRNLEVKNCGKYGIDSNKVNYSLFENLWLHDNGTIGLHPGANDTGWNKYNIYRNIYAYDNTTAGISDVGNQSLPNEYLYNVYENVHAWGNTSQGIQVTNQRGLTINNCSAIDNGFGGFSLYDVEDVNISNCIANLNQYMGVGIESSNKVNLTNVIAKNNNCSSGFRAGFNLKNTTYATLTSCQGYDDRTPKLQDYGLDTEGTTNYVYLVETNLSENLGGNIYNGSSGTITVLKGVVDGDAPTVGDIQYHNGTNWVRLAKGSSGQVLTMSTGNTPEWA